MNSPDSESAVERFSARGRRGPRKPPLLLLTATWVFASTSGFFGFGGSHLLVPDWSETAHAATAAGGELLGLVGLFIAASSVEGELDETGPVRKKR